MSLNQFDNGRDFIESVSLPNSAIYGRVLVIDDAPDLLRLYERLMSKMGLDVTTARNGHEAVELIACSINNGKPFHLIITDIDMPLMNGLEATQRFRELGFTGPIIAISGSEADGVSQDAILAGCNNFIAKPVEPKKLAFILRHYLAQWPAAPQLCAS